SQVEINNVRVFIAMSNSRRTKIDAALQLVKERSIVRPRDLAKRDIPPDYLDRLCRKGAVDRIARGLYAWPEADVSEHPSLAEVALQVPKGVVCLLSALSFHGITTRVPHEVWLALPPKAWSPRVKSPRLRIVRFSGRALGEMVEEHDVEGVTVKVYGVAKTVADCFKYRNKVGLDVALEALRDAWRGGG